MQGGFFVREEMVQKLDRNVRSVVDPDEESNEKDSAFTCCFVLPLAFKFAKRWKEQKGEKFSPLATFA